MGFNILNMSQMVVEPTRVAQHSSTLLDHVYCNEPENISCISVPKYSISAHFPVFRTREVLKRVNKVMTILHTDVYRS